MKRIISFLRVPSLLLVYALLWLPATAQTSIPISDKYFAGQLVFSKGEAVRFQIREGALLTIKNPENAASYLGLVLKLAGSGKIRVLVLNIQSKEGSKGNVSAMSPPKEIALDSSFEVRQSAPITLKIREVGERRFSNPPSNIQDQEKYSSELCCASFGKKQVCANSVITPAGSCP
jgi:hypothetical protein